MAVQFLLQLQVRYLLTERLYHWKIILEDSFYVRFVNIIHHEETVDTQYYSKYTIVYITIELKKKE